MGKVVGMRFVFPLAVCVSFRLGVMAAISALRLVLIWLLSLEVLSSHNRHSGNYAFTLWLLVS